MFQIRCLGSDLVAHAGITEIDMAVDSKRRVLLWIPPFFVENLAHPRVSSCTNLYYRAEAPWEAQVGGSG